MKASFESRKKALFEAYERLILQKNQPLEQGNGIFSRFKYPILTAAHTPIFWRYDLDKGRNPYLMERMGINATFNAGALYFEGRYLLLVRVEGVDRKSFFAVAESPNGIDNFRFWKYPLNIPQGEGPETNVYDMRLVKHEDGWIYGLFCTERKDPNSIAGDTSSAISQCGIIRSKDFTTWERLPDLVSKSSQQRNVVLHPEFVGGKYGFYTRPMDGFIGGGKGRGIAWGYVEDIENPEIEEENIVEPRAYHTIKEVKNGEGPPPIKTDKGWLHLAHGVRNTASGLRYVLYLYMTELYRPWIVTHRPGGYFMAPEGEERVGDVSNVLFCNGWILNENDEVLIYYASSDTRLHAAASTLDQLVDYCLHTPEDGLNSAANLKIREEMIEENLRILKEEE